MTLDAERGADSIEARLLDEYRRCIGGMVEAAVRGNGMDYWRAELAAVMSLAMGLGAVVGATSTLRTAAGAMLDERLVMRADVDGVTRLRDSSAPTLPIVTLSEAIEDMVARTPVTLRDAAQRTGRAISRLYNEAHVVAFVHAAEQSVTERVQQVLVEAMREGLTEGEASVKIRVEVAKVQQDMSGWTDAYTQMAFRTNVNTAVTAGRFQQAQDPEVKQVAPCFRFDAVGDVDTRPNHLAASGLIFATDSPAWQRIAPPLGYRCRCQVSLVTLPMLRRMGRVNPDGAIREDQLPAGAHPDPGFRHQPA